MSTLRCSFAKNYFFVIFFLVDRKKTCFVIILFTSELPYFVHTTSCNLERNLHVTLMVGFCFAQTTFNMKNGFLITNSCYCAYGNDSSNTIHKSCSVPTIQLKNMQHFSLSHDRKILTKNILYSLCFNIYYYSIFE